MTIKLEMTLDELEIIEDENLDDEMEQTWKAVFKKELA